MKASPPAGFRRFRGGHTDDTYGTDLSAPHLSLGPGPTDRYVPGEKIDMNCFAVLGVVWLLRKIRRHLRL